MTEDEVPGLVYGADQGVHFPGGVVEGERGAGGGGDTETSHQRLGAVVADADGDALGIEEGADVVGVHAVHGKGNHRDPPGGVAVQAHPRQRPQPVAGLGCQQGLVPFAVRAVEGLQVPHGRAQSERAGDVRRAGLETLGDPAEGRALEGHLLDHVAAPLVGRHRLQQPGPSPQHADPGRAEDLVAGEGVEVATQRAHVHREMGCGLGTVDEDGDSARLGQGG